MNAYQTAQAYGLRGTDAEIVTQLQATGLTAKPIQLDELLFLLNARGMFVRVLRPAETGEKWGGSIVKMMEAIQASGNKEFIAAIDQWFSHITNSRNVKWDTTKLAYSTAAWGMYATFKDTGIFQVGDFEAVVGLGGGWLFATLTESEYAEQVKAADNDAKELAKLVQRDEWRMRFDAATNTIGTTEQADGVKDLRAIADEIEGA